MKVLALFVLAVVVGTHMIHASSCPMNQMATKLQECSKFVEGMDSKNPNCANMKKGNACFQKMMSDCKDNEAFKGQSKMINDQLAQMKKQIDSHCGCVGVTSSIVLILSACLLSLWFRK